MAYVTREQVSEALFALLCNASFETETGQTSFQTTGRRMMQWDDIVGCQKPALFLMEDREQHMREDLQTPAVRTIMYDAYIFINEGLNPKRTPIITLNRIFDSIDPMTGGVLLPDRESNRLTLGGLVWDCYIDGETIKVPGDFDGTGVGIIPIKAIIP